MWVYAGREEKLLFVFCPAKRMEIVLGGASWYFLARESCGICCHKSGRFFVGRTGLGAGDGNCGHGYTADMTWKSKKVAGLACVCLLAGRTEDNNTYRSTRLQGLICICLVLWDPGVKMLLLTSGNRLFSMSGFISTHLRFFFCWFLVIFLKFYLSVPLEVWFLIFVLDLLRWRTIAATAMRLSAHADDKWI